MKRRILVVEDDRTLRQALVFNLEREGYEVRSAVDGEQALAAARDGGIDLMLLDLMLPGMSGMDFCRVLRQSNRVPIIMVTAKDSEVDKVVGLELGADDYITKPFSVREVLARVNAVVRRSRTQPIASAAPEREEIGNFVIDRPARRVLIDGVEVHVTGREFDLLSHFLLHSGRVQSREVLLQDVWGIDFVGERKTVDVHVRWLREKFGGRVPFEIVTVRGSGYRLDRQPPAASAAAG